MRVALEIRLEGNRELAIRHWILIVDTTHVRSERIDIVCGVPLVTSRNMADKSPASSRKGTIAIHSCVAERAVEAVKADAIVAVGATSVHAAVGTSGDAAEGTRPSRKAVASTGLSVAGAVLAVSFADG